jgi:DNA polymerase elongation subunit (family B)
MILSCRRLKKTEKRLAPIVKLEVALHSFFGKPVQTVKVYCNHATKLARALRRLEGGKGCLEDDVRLSMRHLTDNNVVPCWWQRTGLAEEKFHEKLALYGVFKGYKFNV